MLFLSACILPVTEVYRGTAPVVVEVPGEVQVWACTWSHWNAVETGCANLAEGSRSDQGPFEVKEFTNPVTVIFGEAPLMQTLYVACVDKKARASVYYAWDAPIPGEVRLTDGAHTQVGQHPDADEAARAAIAQAMCDGSAKALPKR